MASVKKAFKKLQKKLGAPGRRKAKRVKLVGFKASNDQDRRRLAATSSKQRTAATMDRMAAYKKAEKMAHGGQVCRGGGAATRGLGFG